MKKNAIVFWVLLVLFLGIGGMEHALASHEKRLSVRIKEVTQTIGGQTVKGTGTVDINPPAPGVTCSKTQTNNCKQRYPTGTEVTLTANPDPGSVFLKWTGKCADASQTAEVTMSKSIKCTAYFAPALSTTTTTTTLGTTTTTTTTSTTLDCSGTTLPCPTTTTTTTTSTTTTSLSSSLIPPPNFKIAFIGDQGLGADSKKVLNLIKDEGADMVLHSGDFEYTNNPDAWDAQINSVLGETFPYFGVIGNHESSKWPKYQQKLIDRINRINASGVTISCTGNIGVAASCTFNGMFLVFSGVGTLNQGNPPIYIHDQLAADNHLWSICSWHKVMTNMQVGSMGNSAGHGVYEACREGAGIIATAHHHGYNRTKTLIKMTNPTVDPAWPNPNNVRVTEGSTFVFVSGLGGFSTHGQKRCSPTSPPYGCNGEWAKIYTNAQHAKFGALFCSFHVDGQPNRGRCYFKNIANEVIDQFEVTRTP